MKTARAVGVAVAALVLAPIAGSTAQGQSFFGQNQVQYDRLDWRVMESEHFLVHYYPSIKEPTTDAARLAERGYARLSRIFGHQFREKKPIILYASGSDFSQSNVFGDQGESTGGVTDPVRQRMALPFSGDFGSFEHVLMHEMVHEFQFDIFARGKAGAGLQNLGQVAPPLWFMEGMAEYLSQKSPHAWTETYLRDAALNGNLPTIEQLTTEPYRFFPYRFGHALWQYIGARWGDDAIGEIMNAVPSLGIERAFKRELGLSLEELSDEWREAMQLKYLPQVATLDRARKFAQPLLSQRKSGGVVNSFVAPSLSPDGKLIAFISYGSLLKGEVFPDLYLADAQTGKRLGRLVKSTTNADYEGLSMIYSQSAFSPDGRTLAFTAQREGKQVIYLLDVRRKKTFKRLDVGFEVVNNPSWSPDGRQLVFSGSNSGIAHLYTVNADGSGVRQLTDGRYGDNMPQWSPDGRSIVFTSDRGEDTDLDLLKFGRWRIAILDLATGRINVPAKQAGLNTNPMWAPDGQSIAYISDRTGISNIFLYDLKDKEQYQLTNVIGSITATYEYSPAITWARQADVLAFAYYEKGDNTVWTVKNPRSLKRAPYREPVAAPAVVASRDSAKGAPVTATVPGAAGARLASARDSATSPRPSNDTSSLQRSWYRTPTESFRLSSDLPNGTRGVTQSLSVAALLDSVAFALPDTTRFRDYRYKVRFQPDYIAQPQVGYAQDNFGSGVYGGTMIVLSDLLSNHQLAFAGAVNGSVSDAQVYASYANLSKRFQYSIGMSQSPIFYPTSSAVSDLGGGLALETTEISRLVQREVFGYGIYPLNRFRRFELGARFDNIDQSVIPYFRTIDYTQNVASGYQRGRAHNGTSVNFVSPFAAYVSDNALYGYTGPIMGHRMRLQVEPSVGTVKWIDYLLDSRRYDPILFNFLTVATRLTSSLTIGPDETRYRRKFIGRPDFLRGYNLENYASVNCDALSTNAAECSAEQLLGSRVAIMNAELRFPLIRRFDLGVLPIALPPIDGLVFYDGGIAWNPGQSISFNRPANYDWSKNRYVLRSYGFGVRFNLLGFAILRYDWAKPLDRPGRKGFGTWSFGPSF